VDHPRGRNFLLRYHHRGRWRREPEHRSRTKRNRGWIAGNRERSGANPGAYDGVRTRFVYTHFMDYAQWNPTFEGYAYNYSVAIPEGYDGSEAAPLLVYMQGWGDRYGVHDGAPEGWNSIWVEVDDPHQTWHYGFNADVDYRTLDPNDPQPPAEGTIVNFTELRILQAVDEVSRLFNVDENRIHGHGSSVGGSGMVTMGMRHDEAIAEFSQAIRLARKSAVSTPTVAWTMQRRASSTRPSRTTASQSDSCRTNQSPTTTSRGFWPLPADPKFRQPAEAVKLALRAVELSPKEMSFWNTLGVAHYRTGSGRRQPLLWRNPWSLRTVE